MVPILWCQFLDHPVAIIANGEIDIRIHVCNRLTVILFDLSPLFVDIDRLVPLDAEFYALSPRIFNKTADVFYMQKNVSFVLLYLREMALLQDCLAAILL